MDFNQVRYFLAVAETLSFTRAAEQCFVSQPALSQAIKRLETELGGELITREGRHTELTELGKTLRSQFEQIDRTRRLVSTTAKAVADGDIGELNIGVMCTIGPHLLAGMLGKFQRMHPMVSLVLHDVSVETVPDLLLSGTIDGAFCSRQGPPHPRLQYFDLFPEAMVVAFPKGHLLAEMDVVPLAEVAKQPYVDRLHCEFRDRFLRFCTDQNLDLDVSFRSESEDWIQDLVQTGAGVTVLPRFSLIRPDLDYRPIGSPTLSRHIEFAVVEPPTALPALTLLHEYVRSYDWNETVLAPRS